MGSLVTVVRTFVWLVCHLGYRGYHLYDNVVYKVCIRVVNYLASQALRCTFVSVTCDDVFGAYGITSN